MGAATPDEGSSGRFRERGYLPCAESRSARDCEAAVDGDDDPAGETVGVGPADLGDLVGRLQSKGFKTETWIPTGAQAAVLSPPSSSNPGFGQPQHSGFGPGGGQQHQQQHGSNQRQQARWTAQLEETLSANDVRSENQ